MENQEEKTVFVIYAGLRDKGGEVVAHFLTLPDDWESKVKRQIEPESLPAMNFIDDYKSRKKSISRNLIVGYIYSLPMTGSTASFGSRVKQIREYPDPSKRAEWVAMSTSLRAGKEAESFQEREVKRRVDLEALEPLRRAYERLSMRDRAALLVRVQKYLMTGR